MAASPDPAASTPDRLSPQHAEGVQIGDGNTQHNYFGRRRPVTWPQRVGVVPRSAHGRQSRPADQDLADAGSGGTAVVCQVVAGLGGVGKTQLAANLAERLWAEQAVDLLLWVTASSRTSILSAYALAAGEVAGFDDPDPQQAAVRLLSWLARTGRRWLIVLDDLTDPADLTGLWPPDRPAGRTVVTTRRRDAALLAGRQLVDVGVFTPEQATAYLTRLLGDDPVRLGEAGELATELGHLPLALAQAAAYMIDQDLTCAAYRDRLRRRPLVRLRPEALPDQQSRPVARAWTLSIEAAGATTGGLAPVLLQLAAILDPNGIPVELFTTRTVLDHCAAGLRQRVERDRVHDTLRVLHRLSLADVDAHTLRVHALVQRVTRDTTAEPDRQRLAFTAADAMANLWPDIERDPATSRLGQRLRAGTAALAEHTGPLLWHGTDGVHTVLFKAGHSLGEIGLVAAARDYFTAMRAVADAQLGADHRETLAIRHNVARWRGEAGDAAGAVTAYEQLLADALRVLGPDHPYTLSTRGNLARCRGEAGDPARAAAEFEHLLTDRLRLLGPDHPHTLTTRSNLARWRGTAGDPAGAAAALEQLLTDRLRLAGPDHPSTLSTRHNVAFWRGVAGDPAGAAAALEQLLTDRLRVLGPDHPSTLSTRNNLAHWRGRAGDPAGAAAALDQLLADRLRVLGPDHPHTLNTRGLLARWRGEAGDAAGAASAYEELLADRLRVLGAEHPDTRSTREDAGYWREQARRPV
ncbi:tetratricopeptide repeat protein [Actinoplanes sp. GCM10030250]|uniref:tetratricopeptide repeat protein n=1 Tax=Actinoplanes sp. GCM10030250 TaxID=3273376 RepID=UPI003606C4D3